jgi:hypothetical protein
VLHTRKSHRMKWLRTEVYLDFNAVAGCNFTNPDHVQSGHDEYSHSIWMSMRKCNGHHCCLEQWRNHLVHLRGSSQQLLQK